MTAIVWDNPGERIYENGLDRGVLYLSTGKAVPWNGLTSVSESATPSLTPVYFDGQLVSNITTPGSFSGTITAITYPDELLELEGLERITSSVFIADQRPKTFNLSYRTQIGNGLDGNPIGYKIHVIYNVTAIPTDKNWATIGSDSSFVEFQWDISAIPEEAPGFRPSSHIIIDSRNIDQDLLNSLELMLYGGTTASPTLLPFSELISFISNWNKVEIIDNNDGTWTAYSLFDGYIHLLINDEFRLDNVNAVYLDANTYEISNT